VCGGGGPPPPPPPPPPAPRIIEKILYELYQDWHAEERLSAVVIIEEVTRNGCNLSPSRYVASNDVEPPLEEVLMLLAQVEEAWVEANVEPDAVLSGPGFADQRASRVVLFTLSM
jgi:hypothetical protein